MARYPSGRSHWKEWRSDPREIEPLADPLTLTNWEKQAKELNAKENADTQPDTGGSDDVLDTPTRTAKDKKLT